MRRHTLSRVLTDQRGIALPMALVIILILSALMAGFSMLGASEPTVAANQQRVAQARAMAESGVERAIWALNNPDDANGIPSQLVTPAAPYDGITVVPVTLNGAQVGVFTVRVSGGEANCPAVNERCIVATGWAPTNAGTGPKARQRIQVTAIKLRNFGPDAPAALTVRGELNVGGHTLIDSRGDGSCGHKAGTWSKGPTAQGGSSKVYGWGDDTANTQVLYADNPGGDIVTQVPDPAPPTVNPWDSLTYTSDELNMLKAIAKAQGTYYQGTVQFNASNKLPDGLIFVDTVSGQNITPATPVADFGSLMISGNPSVNDDGIFHGWLIVNGSANIQGNVELHALVYVVNDLTYKGTGNGKIVGAVISQNVRDFSSTSIDSDLTGNSTIIYNCDYARNGDNGAPVSETYTIKLGTYKAG